jgi:hypothetical protein
MRRPVKLLLTGLLVCGVALQVVIPRIFPSSLTLTTSLETVIPAEVVGWSVRTLPIADTEALQNQVSKVLRYDEAVFRNYQRGSLQVGIYAAHWNPGKASYSVAGAHTPDTCWVAAGWSRSLREHAVPIRVANRSMIPAEMGTFEKGGSVQHVMFWHLVGGRPITFDQVGWDERWPARFKRGLSFITDLARFGFDQRRDQCFVRVTCNQPIREVLRDAEFQELLQLLSPLGIFASLEPAGSYN